MNDKDKHFIERYEELLNKGYCNCNEMNCIDNNSPRRILDIVKQLQSNLNSLREWLEEQQKEVFHIGDKIGVVDSVSIDVLLDKMNELEKSDNK